MEYTIKTTTEGVDFGKVREILHSHGLSQFDVETQRKVFENSYAVVFLYIQDELVGVGRAISDGICQAALYNLALEEAYCTKGLGKVILDELLRQVEGCNVIFYTHPKWLSLYEHWGFKRMKTGFALYQDEEHLGKEGFF